MRVNGGEGGMGELLFGRRCADERVSRYVGPCLDRTRFALDGPRSSAVWIEGRPLFTRHGQRLPANHPCSDSRSIRSVSVSCPPREMPLYTATACSLEEVA